MNALKGLLYKDLYLIRNSILIGMGLILGVTAFGIIVVLGMTQGNFKSISEEADIFHLFFKGIIFLVMGAGIYIALNSASAIDMDTKSEWFKVLYASPITVMQEIMSRYLLAFIVNTLMTIWAAVMLPLIFLAGDKGYGVEEMKLIVYCWLFGILMILIRLPIDIVFPPKTSTAITVGIISIVLVGLMVWITVSGDDVVVAYIMRGIRFVYHNGVVFTVGTVILSFVVSYFGKRGRRWA